ncbi:MAG: hypothetical protein RLZZ19_307, partial [Actinomycetota bacterium]
MNSGPHLPQERKVVTAIPGPRSQELLKRRTEAVSAALGMAIPVVVEKAGGGVIIDVDGNSIIDMGAGIAVVNVGNSADRVVKNVQAQVEAFTHTCFMIAPYMGYIEVCEALNRLTPGSHKKKSALFNSGAEAVENAVKIARKYTKRQAVVVFEHGYHGRTNLTMAMTAKNAPYKEGFGPFTPEVYRMPMSYPFRCDSCSGTCESSVLETVIHKIEKEIGASNVACVVIEPIMGEGGFIVPCKGFLPGLSQFCKDNGILFVADEVQTGFARTGQMFACEDEGIIPDLITTAKGIAGGLPLADGGNGHIGALADFGHPLAQRGNGDFPGDDDDGGNDHEDTAVPLHQYHQRRGDHQLVGHRVQEPTEGRGLVPGAGKIAIKPVGDGRDQEDARHERILQFKRG